MKRYPVYKALFKSVYSLGIPLLALVIEITFAALFIVLGMYIAIPFVAVIHIIIMIALKQDPFILPIITEVASLKNQKEE